MWTIFSSMIERLGSLMLWGPSCPRLSEFNDEGDALAVFNHPMHALRSWYRLRDFPRGCRKILPELRANPEIVTDDTKCEYGVNFQLIHISVTKLDHQFR